MPALRLLATCLVALFALTLPASSAAQGLGGFVSPGPLAEDHADLDNILKCTSCHEPGAGVTPTRCMACHERVEEQVRTETGFHANLGEECASCHSDHKGRDFALIQLVQETFNHQVTGFALTGEHAPLDCVECHTDAPEDYTGLSSDCSSCHDEPHGAGASTRELLSQCRSCHDADDWDATPIPLSVFDHDDPKQADYPLHAAHDDVACDDCHKETRFVPTVAELCTDCHDDPHRNQFRNQACTDCHTDERPDWRVTPWDHDKRTKFALVGVHNDVRCSECHGSGPSATYVPLPHERCSTCHEDVHEGQFDPRDCDDCHQQVAGGFVDFVIDHDQTNYPLRNAHKEVTCEDCHGEGPAATFAGLPFADCDDCHEDKHDARFEPDSCDSCHATDGLWDVAEFDHGRTDFMLNGAHVEVTCAECHGEDEQKVLTPIDHATCRDCHSDDDPHEGSVAELPCTTCHTDYDPTGQQWDFGAARVMPGHWRETADGMSTGQPALGVTAKGDIVPAVPGMVMTYEPPDGPTREQRLFAPAAPHTTGPGLACAKCHRAPVPIGIGTGELSLGTGGASFQPAAPSDRPDRSADGWVGLREASPGSGTRLGFRSLDRAERERVLRVGVCLACHTGQEPWFQTFDASVDRWRKAPGSCELSPDGWSW